MIDYHTTHMKLYQPVVSDEPISSLLALPASALEPVALDSVWMSLPVCSYLIGTKWDQLALAAVSTLRPYSIRVTLGETTSDAIINRVTVYVNDEDIIRSIEMEVRAEIEPGSAKHGHEFLMQLRSKCGGNLL